jgi:hypothetical protein
MNNPISPSKRSLLWDIPALELAVFVVAGLGCWLLGYRTWTDVGMALMIAGSAVILVGVVGFLLASGPVAVNCAKGQGRSSPLRQQMCSIATYMSGWSFVLLLGLSGLLALGLGFLIAKIAEL